MFWSRPGVSPAVWPASCLPMMGMGCSMQEPAFDHNPGSLPCRRAVCGQFSEGFCSTGARDNVAALWHGLTGNAEAPVWGIFASWLMHSAHPCMGLDAPPLAHAPGYFCVVMRLYAGPAVSEPGWLQEWFAPATTQPYLRRSDVDELRHIYCLTHACSSSPTAICCSNGKELVSLRCRAKGGKGLGQ